MQSTQNKKSSKIGLLILSIVVILVIGGIWHWNTHKKGLIKEEIVKTVNKKSNGLYTIEYGNLELNEATGNLSISNVSITYDSTKMQKLLDDKNAPARIFKITADSIVVTGVKTPKALLDKEVVASTLFFAHPTIEIINTKQENDSLNNIPHKEIYEQLLGNLKLIKIDSIKLQNASLIVRNIKAKKHSLDMPNFDITMGQVLVDSISANDKSRLLFAETLTASSKKISWDSKDGLYQYQIKELQLNSSINEASIDSFFLQPNYSEEAFMKQYETQVDRYHFNLYNIQIKALQFADLINNKFIAGQVTMNNSSFKIYHDLNMPPNTKSKVGNYPQQALMKIQLPIFIQKLSVSNSFVEYKEKNAKTKMDGKVQFYNADATVNNVTNMKEKIKGNNKLIVDMKTDFLDKIPFTAKWTMYLMNPEGKFNIIGNMQAFDATVLNKVTEPMGPAKIESGNIKSIKFDLTGTNHAMDGNISILYDDLKVSLLKKDGDEEDDKLKKKKIASIAANFFIKNSNPQKGKEVRVTPVHYERDATRSIFSLIWKSIFTGAKDNIGLKN